jgi:hypothetical protein
MTFQSSRKMLTQYTNVLHFINICLQILLVAKSLAKISIILGNFQAFLKGVFSGFVSLYLF